MKSVPFSDNGLWWWSQFSFKLHFSPMSSIIFWGSGEMVFSIVFQVSTGKKLWGKNHGKNPGTRKFDAKHSAIDFCKLKIHFVKLDFSKIKYCDKYHRFRHSWNYI